MKIFHKIVDFLFERSKLVAFAKAYIRERRQRRNPLLPSVRKEKSIMKNLFKLYSEEELEVRNENLEENIEGKDELISDVNGLEDVSFDEALLFF